MMRKTVSAKLPLFLAPSAVLLSLIAPPSLNIQAITAQTGDRGMQVKSTGQAERRVALVIGNSDYGSLGRLLNPINDARDMARTLRELGFDVIYGENLSQNDMKRSIRAFGDKIRGGGVGLFYFAGHGVQVNGSNYLIPIGATVTKEEEVEYESVDVGFVLAQMEGAGNELNIVILDACRDNPFAKSFRSANRGLALIKAAGEMLIAYATAPGSTASDGPGKNGLYTQELLKNIRKPGLSLEQVFKQVRSSVKEKTRNTQVPWESSSLVKDFYFIRGTVSSNPRNQENVELQTYTEGAAGSAIEMVGVPGGKFLMGSPHNEPGYFWWEGPQHSVTVSSFYMGKYEVTQAQWRAVAGLQRVKIDLNPDPSYFKGDNLPVEGVSWHDAIEFCDRLSRTTGKTYRLPTEAEWEYAARAMTTGPYAGNLDEMGWYVKNSGRLRLDENELAWMDQSNRSKRLTENGNQTHPVGTKQANGFGLYDMHGNVWEWCMDWHSQNYYFQSPSVDPTGPSTGSDRVKRGGGWSGYGQFCRSADRAWSAPGARYSDGGFRLVRTSN